MRYVHAGNEPHLIAGVATETLELLEERPDVDAIIVPVGSGSGAAGACIVAQAVRPETEVIAVQSEAAPAAYRSWSTRRLVEDRRRRSPRGWPRGSPASCRSESCVSGSTTSCS